MSAEYSARAQWGDRSGLIFESAGTKPFPQVMRDEVRNVLIEKGIDPIAHKIRPVSQEILSGADLVVAMGLGHREHLQEHFGITVPYYLEIARGTPVPLLDVDEADFDHRTEQDRAIAHAQGIVNEIWSAMPGFLENHRRWIR